MILKSIQQLDGLLPAFSYPQALYKETLDSLVPTIANEYAAGLTGACLRRHIAAIELSSVGLVDYLTAWVADPWGSVGDNTLAKPQHARPLLGWDYSFGDAYRAYFTLDADQTRVFASIATHLAACGISGAWRTHFAGSTRLRWDNWLLPAADFLSVETDGTSATVEYSGPEGAGKVSLRMSDGSWNTEDAEKLHKIDIHGVTFTVLVRKALAMRDYEDLTERALSAVDARRLGVFIEALDILAENAPEYLPWIARTFHQLFLLIPKSGKIESGSVEHYLGLIHLTEHFEPLPIAELLVHEATHQYMNILMKLEPLDDGSDTKLYWSPAVETVRPVSKIVAAFHAFGNVLLFYRRCRERGMVNSPECDRQHALLSGWMRDLIPPITDNPALTKSGRALCEPLGQIIAVI